MFRRVCARLATTRNQQPDASALPQKAPATSPRFRSVPKTVGRTPLALNSARARHQTRRAPAGPPADDSHSVPPARATNERPTLTLPHSPTTGEETINQLRGTACACSLTPLPPVIYTARQTAEILNASTGTLRRWRASRPRRGPAYVRIEGQIGYRHEDVQDYLAAHRVTGAAA
ncbi:helix-turn-helix domain-containing protein [Peterkaempfera bronchialis]|uniref:helix-turn-helix domain-containing protein n=1 Tax=Peterkaempfera bronchialis TaxID=2126346 RepID=UPI003C2B467B